VQVTGGEGEVLTLQRPYVIKDLCIGCGICEYQCPMGGESAIRIHVPTITAGTAGPAAT